MSRRVDRLISHIRKASENETTNSTTDIDDNEIIQYLNEGQHRIQSKIIAQHPRVFIAETTINAVADQEEYNLPSDVFMASKIIAVEYTDDSSANKAYTKLLPGYERDRQSHISGFPTKYIRRDKLDSDVGTILLTPRPSNSSGTLRVTYIQRIDELDKRRGIISAVTDSGTAVTALTLDVSGTPPIDSEDLSEHDYFCVVSKTGDIKMRNVQFDSIDTSTGVVTLTDGSHTYESGETIAVGDYIVGGKDTTSHSRFPRNVERYLIEFAIWKIFKRDSSTDSTEQLQELLAIESDILESFQEIQEDIVQIPVLEEWEY